MFRINDVYKLHDTSFRILKMTLYHIVWIDIDSQSANPFLIEKNELTKSIEANEAEWIEDPFADIALLKVVEGSIQQQKRDAGMALIRPLITHDQFFDPSIRFDLVKRILEQQKSTHQTIYRLARRYWQRGQIPNALIPSYQNSGAKGSKRIAKDKKLGRPRKFMPGTGALIDVNIERLFRININKHMLTKDKYSLGYAYRKFYTMYHSLFPDVPDTEIPSIWQFKHFYEREFPKVTQITARSDPILYNKDIRALHSTVNTQVLGPGSRYEIDATIADIYLVSDSDRACIVGRPTIYFVVDVFSRMVVGFYIGFENASYVTAMQALQVAMTDKVELCKQYGYEITSEEWPCIGLPDAVLADRGELLGHQIEALEHSFSIRIENTAPYRGDLKPIVERYFRTAQAKFKPFAQGVVQPFKEKKRGGSDYRLDATLTIHDFKQIIIGSILTYNLTHQLKKYDRDLDMPTDLPLVPIHLWNWGIQHRVGRLKQVSEKALRVALLPKTKATLSDLGLKVFGVFYYCAEIHQQGWMHRKKSISRPDTLQVAYDPSNAEIIYVFYQEDSLHYWEAVLAPRSREFMGCSFWEVWQVQQEQKKTQAIQELGTNKSKAALEEHIESIIAQANAQKPKTASSKKQRVTGIRENRQREKNHERLARKADHLKNPRPEQPTETVSESTNNIIQMPKSKQKLEHDEDYQLTFGIYQDLLEDIDHSDDED
ncbi:MULTISPECIES: Mu transposase C-terminal domain-containing protein [Acinetobacter]|uniref:Transposase n=1 Tax=Acinetobacter soli TaxID=487316 RepID=A0A1P8EKT2_9GAMM|nr:MULTISPECIES: Mu transposase C-terminal domain-containing protein [Acinetobacter]APV36817.1 transposase [Acinetobacter soli]MDI9723907.1 DDE-type integrase/transposase/recombinase [Acinetobacter baumannii]MDQ8999621.1 DDE-type integrase/transposase/recombinase [Acinetobacter baumannii]MDQ9003078.1 DDE-type integrase/transposase/recombinase [Acinetobacter baumannii]MDR9525757.1 DDE-type integrase/transposase/recombinase [Acinetobacter baumannii]